MSATNIYVYMCLINICIYPTILFIRKKKTFFVILQTWKMDFQFSAKICNPIAPWLLKVMFLNSSDQDL
jgi:hypothetical protein